MTFLSCLVIGLAFLLAVGLLLLASVLLGWHVPAALERKRQAGRAGDPPAEDKEDQNGASVIDPPEPRA